MPASVAASATLPITADQVRLVQSSFARLLPQADAVAALFYQQLFVLDPALKALFRSDPARQGERLMQMIGQAVAMLDRPAALLPVLHALGRRHVAYGVRASHYPVVGQALLDTLALGLGEAFGEAERAAWTGVYGLIAKSMQEDLYVTAARAA